MTNLSSEISGKQLFVGKRGGTYYFDEKGRKVYVYMVDKQHLKAKRKRYNPPTGAFLRYLQNNS
jgi:hypothetical protein